jgi:predicted hydrocarbon binding protein
LVSRFAGSSVAVVTLERGTHRLGLAARKEAALVSEQRMLEAGRVRGLIDGIAAVAGNKVRDMALRHADLEEYIENPPPMSETDFLPAEQYVRLVGALSDVFGKGSKALQIYAGEETMRRAIEGMPRLFGPVMKFLPGGLKKQAIFRLIATQVGKGSGVPATVQFDGGKVTYSCTTCGSCIGRQSDEPVCHYEAGVLLAAAELTAGKKHKVTEVKCMAMGDEACVHVIEEVGGDA